MGKIVGIGATKKVKTYTEDEVNKLIESKSLEIDELTKQVNSLTEERDSLQAQVNSLTNDIVVNEKEAEEIKDKKNKSKEAE